VNGTTPYRRGTYYRSEVLIGNRGGAACQGVIVSASVPNQTNTITSSIVLPRSMESFNYDWDGNLISDGLWTYEWDGENHLKRMATTLGTGIMNSVKKKIEFMYDYLG